MDLLASITGSRNDVAGSPGAHSFLQSVTASLPRYEGFGTTLGGFTRSPQINKLPPSLLQHVAVDQGYEHTLHDGAADLQSPLLTTDSADHALACQDAQQNTRPKSLLARSLSLLSLDAALTKQVRASWRTSAAAFDCGAAFRRLSPLVPEHRSHVTVHQTHVKCFTEFMLQDGSVLAGQSGEKQAAASDSQAISGSQGPVAIVSEFAAAGTHQRRGTHVQAHLLPGIEDMSWNHRVQLQV